MSSKYLRNVHIFCNTLALAEYYYYAHNNEPYLHSEWTDIYFKWTLCCFSKQNVISYSECIKNNEIKDAELFLIKICIAKPASAAVMHSVYETAETAIDTSDDSSLERKVHRGPESISVSWDWLKLTPAPLSHTWSLAESHLKWRCSLWYPVWSHGLSLGNPHLLGDPGHSAWPTVA